MYLWYIGEEKAFKLAAEEACSALAWAYSISGLTFPSTHPLLKVTLEGLQCPIAKPVVKKELLIKDTIEAVLLDSHNSGSLSDMRLATACLLEYAAFLHFSHLVDLRPCDFSISEDMMTTRICHSSDLLRNGDEMVLARTKSKTCLVSRLQCYLRRVGMTTADETKKMVQSFGTLFV